MFFKIENNNDCYIKYSNPISKKTKLLCYIFKSIFKAVWLCSSQLLCSSKNSIKILNFQDFYI